MIHTEDIIREVAEGMQQSGIPRYMFGNPITLSNIVVREKQVHKKYPVIILMEDIKEEVVRSNLSAVDRMAPLQLFFMERADPRWTSVQHMDNAVKPMRELMRDFLQRLEKDFRVHSVENRDSKVHTNWGLKAEVDGQRRSVFPDWLSGLELTVELKIFKEIRCRRK